MRGLAAAEREPLDIFKLKAVLTDTKRRLELVDAIENPVERTCKRDQLLELIDWLEEEIASSVSE